jgi:hypothetical protein
MGKVILTVLGMVGEMKLTFIKERQRADKAAKAADKYRGRPVTIDQDKVRTLIRPVACLSGWFGINRHPPPAGHTSCLARFSLSDTLDRDLFAA